MPLAERKTEVNALGPVVVENINAILVAKGIPKMRFYQACGITPGAYSQWKSGLTIPSFKSLDRIAEFLEVPVENLMGSRRNAVANVRQNQKRRITHGYRPGVAVMDREINAVIQDAKDRYGIMFDASKGATEDEMLATIAFLRTLREQRSADED